MLAEAFPGLPVFGKLLAHWRTIAAVLVAPIVPGAAIAAVLLALDQREEAELAFLTGVYFGLPIALLIGLPIHAALVRLGLTRWFVYVTSGMLLGALLYFFIPVLIDVVIRLQGVAGGNVMFSLTLLPPAAAFVGSAALAFWLIARPDLRSR